MVDGVDGSGKSTVVAAWKKYLSEQGNAIFDLRHYLKENDHYPESHEMRAYDFIFSAEPTYTGIGKVLREELINKNNNYSALSIAHGYSLDRLVLYTKTLLPLLKDGKFIIQDRGVSSSLAYQPAQDPNLTLDILSQMPGNQLALENCPDHLVIVKVNEQTAVDRLNGRTDKQDDSIFEKQEFLKKLVAQYDNPEFQNVFKKRGTQIHYLSGEEKIGIMEEQSINLLKKLLK